MLDQTDRDGPRRALRHLVQRCDRRRILCTPSWSIWGSLSSRFDGSDDLPRYDSIGKNNILSSVASPLAIPLMCPSIFSCIKHIAITSDGNAISHCKQTHVNNVRQSSGADHFRNIPSRSSHRKIYACKLLPSKVVYPPFFLEAK